MNSYETFHSVLTGLFQDIMSIEEKAIITEEFRDITNNDMHILEAIGRMEPRNMSTVAKKLSITVGTLTTAINSLVKKRICESRAERGRQAGGPPVPDRERRKGIPAS